jgi:hypothetical protein
MKNYAKEAVEHALAALTPETENDVEEIVQDGYTAFFRLISDLAHRERYSRIGFENYQAHGYPTMREDMTAIMLYATAIVYEWDKNHPHDEIKRGR